MKYIVDNMKIMLHHTDAAGILFFANQLVIVHDIYEKFMNDIGCSFQDRFVKQDYLIPIIHAEADYLKPLTVGDEIEIKMIVEKIGFSSFELSYRLTDKSNEIVGRAKTVHVIMDPVTRKKIELPRKLKSELEKYFN